MGATTATRQDGAVSAVPTGAALGAEVCGIDLRHVTDAQFDAIHRAWLDHSVLLFRGQSLSDDDLVAFSRRFVEGKPESYIVSNVLGPDGQAIGGRATWCCGTTAAPCTGATPSTPRRAASCTAPRSRAGRPLRPERGRRPASARACRAGLSKTSRGHCHIQQVQRVFGRHLAVPMIANPFEPCEAHWPAVPRPARETRFRDCESVKARRTEPERIGQEQYVNL